MASNNVATVTESNFESDVLQAATPVLLDFWAPWCGPCKMIAPILDEIANEKGGSVKIAKVNVDENPGLSSRFGIRAIPTMLIFKNGEVQEQIVGMTSKGSLVAKLEALV